MIPATWLVPARMERIVCHWSAGGPKASALDKKHYHVIHEADGTPVRGVLPISSNQRPVGKVYAAHTKGCNSGSIGLSVACMLNAIESPFNAGKHPMTEKQFESMAETAAQCCKFYGIKVTPQTVLWHAEVQGTLRIAQNGKWDATRLPFKPELKGAKPCGDYLRARVSAHLAGLK